MGADGMRVAALTIHDVRANGHGQQPEPDPFYRITLEELETLLLALRRLGYQTATSREFRAWQKGRVSLPNRTVVLTFDDGLASHLEQAAALLVRHRFVGTFFIPVDRIGRPGMLTWEQLRRLAFLGMEIGSHGMSHRALTQLSRPQLQQELIDSKRILEEKLGIPIEALAAPGGFWNPTVAREAREAGYDAAWVSTIGTNGRQTHPLALRRVVVRRPFSVETLVRMVEGWLPSFWWAANQQLLIRLLKRTLGIYGYEQLKRRLVPHA